MNAIQYKMQSPVGSVFLTASAKGLSGVFWKPQAGVPFVTTVGRATAQEKFLAQALKQLEEYFSGKRKTFDLVFDVQGTPFQKQVWAALAKIPFGKTCSYRDIAKAVKNEKAVRAVGTANGRNPLSIVVPCHRVIASNGTLAGYAGTVGVKQKLLDLEKR